MVDVRPFRALRVDAARAHEVVAPPYDVMTTDEARTMVAGGRNQFLHVSRPEIDLSAADPYSDAAYAQARTALEAFTADGTFVREPAPVMYVLRQTMGALVQIGLVASASVDDYDATAIRIHEYTRADKELDRVRHVDAVDAHDEPVFLTYRSDSHLTSVMEAAMTRDPIIDVVDEAGVWHELWTIDDEAVLATIVEAFAAIPVVYVADGHHRSAAASAVRKRRRGSATGAPASTTSHPLEFADGLDGFLAVFVPTDRTHVMAYHRVVNDLGYMTHVDFLDEVEKVASVEPVDEAFAPTDQHTFGLFMGSQWYRCTFRAPPNDPDDPLQQLDVSMMQERILAPILGITDPRTDPRLHFVGGIRGTHELERRVEQGAAAAFSLPATSVDDLLQVADRSEVMPPKSTWFEPKLPSGLVLHPIS